MLQKCTEDGCGVGRPSTGRNIGLPGTNNTDKIIQDEIVVVGQGIV